MAKKIPRPRVKSKKMHWLDKLFMGIGGLSPFTGKAALHQSMSGATKSGRAAQAAQLKRLAKYGKWGSRAARFSGLMNPYTAVPAALLFGAQHIVGNAMEPYKNQDVENTGWFFDNRGISKEGSARLLRERLAREDLVARIRAAKEGGAGFWELARMRPNPDDFYQHPEYLKNAPGIKRDTQLSDKDFTERHGGSSEEGKWFNFNEGGIARLL